MAVGQDILHHPAPAAALLRGQLPYGLANGSRLLASYLITASMPERAINSNEVTPPAVRSVAMPSRSTAACGEGTAA